jgi:integrase
MKEIKPINNNGSISIQFQLNNKTYKFSPIKGGKYSNPRDLAKAQDTATQITIDICNGIFDPTLKKYKTITSPSGRTAVDALRDLEEAKQELEQRSISVDVWDKYVEFKKPSVSPSTIAKDYTKVRNYLIKVTEAKHLLATELRNWLLAQTTPAATKKILQQLSACSNWAVKQGLMSINPFEGMATEIKLPKSAKSKKVEAFTQEEAQQIIEAFRNNTCCPKRSNTKHSHYADFVDFLFASGCRHSEVIALQWKHISNDCKSITLERAVVEGEDGRVCKQGLKTQAQRILPTSKRIQALLENIKSNNPDKFNPDNLVFPSPEGTWIDLHNFCQRQWKVVLNGLGIPYRKPYSTRHTLITYALQQGLDVKDIAVLVGNSPQIIYQRYASARKELRLPD